MHSTEPVDVVTQFLAVVRSGQEPDRAGEFMAPRVLAHQVRSDNPETVERSPANYADHVREMIADYGVFDFVVDELFGSGPKVYARWTQTGTHLTEIDGVPATRQPLIEVASCVYRVIDGLIVEYWIQIDAAGLHAQLEDLSRRITQPSTN